MRHLSLHLGKNSTHLFDRPPKQPKGIEGPDVEEWNTYTHQHLVQAQAQAQAQAQEEDEDVKLAFAFLSLNDEQQDTSSSSEVTITPHISQPLEMMDSSTPTLSITSLSRSSSIQSGRQTYSAGSDVGSNGSSTVLEFGKKQPEKKVLSQQLSYGSGTESNEVLSCWSSNCKCLRCEEVRFVVERATERESELQNLRAMVASATSATRARLFRHDSGIETEEDVAGRHLPKDIKKPIKLKGGGMMTISPLRLL
ncbi:hypothetical protein HDU97_003586 [Phlyctochytrium planicorne]|nr:hypothetical protein HDU97_003586 [Phlyctochytrium planicorne]